MAVKKILALVLTICMALVALPAFGGDRPLDPKRDLSGISPKRHRYIFTMNPDRTSSRASNTSTQP